VTILVFSLVNSKTQPTDAYRIHPLTHTDCHALHFQEQPDLLQFLDLASFNRKKTTLAATSRHVPWALYTKNTFVVWAQPQTHFGVFRETGNVSGGCECLSLP